MLGRLGGLGQMNGRSGGQVEPYITPTLPQAANIVRAWSLRRCVPAYLNGVSIRADRPTAPVGAPGIEGKLNKAGVIDFPSGADANAYELHDQKGRVESALVIANLANAPVVYASGAMLKGLQFPSGNSLVMQTVDTVLAAVLADIATGFTVSFWFRSNDVTSSTDILIRRSGTIGYLDFRIASGSINVRIRESSFRASGTITANAWQHIVVTVRKSGAYDKRLVYVNAGAPSERVVADPASVGAAALTLQSNSATVSMNDLAFWNRELSAAEVAALFEAQRTYYGVAAK